VAIGGALIGQRSGRRGHILDPLGHFARRAVADIARDIGLGADLLGKIHNSWVPKLLGSVTPPQWVLTLTGRLVGGPMPSRQ
jgi:hypothetical protein